MQNNEQIIIKALCKTIEEKDAYIRQLEDTVVYQRRIINKEDSNEGQASRTL